MYDLSELRRIPIDRILSDIGYECAASRCGYTMYHSPLRVDKNPSFAVDKNRNRWHDFALGTDGSNIDLVIRLGLAPDCGGAARYLALRYLPSLRVTQTSEPCRSVCAVRGTKSEKGPPAVTSVTPLRSPALRRYITDTRCIPPHVADKYLQEVHCRMPSGCSVYGAGLLNRSGGYAVRNQYLKMAVPPVDITLIPAANGKRSDECQIFEGVLSFLSQIALQGVVPRIDTIILNSIINTHRAENVLSQYCKIHCYLDNDNAGAAALETIRSSSPTGTTVVDESWSYMGYNDLNDKLIDLHYDK